MDKLPRIALLIESSRAYGRGLLRGIANYVEIHGPWSLDHQERALREAAPAGMRDWSGDGIIARIESRRLVEQIQQMGLPTVDLRGMYDLEGIPIITPNQQAVARLAARELIERGFEHFGYCGFAGLSYCEQRCAHFVQYVADAGYEASIFEDSRSRRPTMSFVAEAKGLLQKDALAAWIRSLPKPVGLMTCNDIRAQQVVNVCREYGIAVPDKVAVIGVDNDEVMCRLSDPPLSSIELGAQKAGYEAAALLGRMMKGQAPPTERILIEPLGVVTRRSTDVLAIADDDVVAAVRFIREHACDGIRVEDVRRHVELSRSTLERRFDRFLGRAPRAEIIRIQMQRVKELLIRTDYPVEKIAQLAGFNHVESMSNLFKSRTGQTPGAYREKWRAHRLP